MGCSTCSKRMSKSRSKTYDVLGGHKHLPDIQIRARLEVFKKRYCSNCDNRYECNYVMYKNCGKKQQ